MLYFKYLSSRIVIGSLTLVVFLSLSMTSVMAKDITIQVWSGGTNVNDAYRIDAITMAADILEKEAAIRGEKLNIRVDGKYDFDGWGGFKQAVTLAAEAKKAPHIVVTGHGDIAPYLRYFIISKETLSGNLCI